MNSIHFKGSFLGYLLPLQAKTEKVRSYKLFNGTVLFEYIGSIFKFIINKMMQKKLHFLHNIYRIKKYEFPEMLFSRNTEFLRQGT